MKNEIYESPQMEVVEIGIQQTLCQSGVTECTSNIGIGYAIDPCQDSGGGR